MSKLTIGQLARESGVGVETIRFYERKGLIQQPRKASSGFRIYDAQDPRRIRFIKRAQDLGFTLKEIKSLLELNTGKNVNCDTVAKKSQLKIVEITEKISDLHRMLAQLESLKKACSVGKEAMACCRVMDCFENSCKPKSKGAANV